MYCPEKLSLTYLVANRFSATIIAYLYCLVVILCLAAFAVGLKISFETSAADTLRLYLLRLALSDRLLDLLELLLLPKPFLFLNDIGFAFEDVLHPLRDVINILEEVIRILSIESLCHLRQSFLQNRSVSVFSVQPVLILLCA